MGTEDTWVQKENQEEILVWWAGGHSCRSAEAWMHTLPPRRCLLLHLKQSLTKSRTVLWNKAVLAMHCGGHTVEMHLGAEAKTCPGQPRDGSTLSVWPGGVLHSSGLGSMASVSNRSGEGLLPLIKGWLTFSKVPIRGWFELPRAQCRELSLGPLLPWVYVLTTRLLSKKGRWEGCWLPLALF